MIKKSRQEYLGFNDTWLVLLGIPVVSVLVNIVLFGNTEAMNDLRLFGKLLIVSFSFTIALWLAIRESHFLLLKRFPDVSQTRTRLLLIVAASIVIYTLVNITVGNLLKPFVHEVMELEHFVEKVTTGIFIILVIGLYEALYLSNKLKQSNLEKERLVKENINSQLEGLRSQVNPHFLFNSLNTLATLIPENAEKGVNFVTKLAKVYRYMLESRNENLIHLSEELEFLKAYVYLLRQRFGDNLKIEISINTEVFDLYILPLALQITFENAIKHNVISKEFPLSIEVFNDENDKIVVRNNLQKKKVIGGSTKVGLQNIKNRYAFYTNKTVDVLTSEEYFAVNLPLVEKQKN